MDNMLSPPDASRYLAERGVKHSIDTLNRYRVIGGGPAFIKMGRWVRYPVDQLDAYIARLRSPLMASTHQAVVTEPAPVQQ